MKYFIETLVDQGLITESQASQVMLEQSAGLPSQAQLAAQLQLLDDKQIYQVMIHQARGQMSFQGACQELHLWTPELEHTLKSELQQSARSLTQILLDQQLINFENLNQALDRYLAQANQARAEQPTPIAPLLDPPATPLIAAPIEAISPQSPTLLQVVPDIVDSYSVLISEKQEELLAELLPQSLKNLVLSDIENLTSADILLDAENIEASLRALFHGFHKLKGILLYAQVDGLVYLCERIEHMLEIALAHVPLQGNTAPAVCALCTRAVEVIWTKSSHLSGDAVLETQINFQDLLKDLSLETDLMQGLEAPSKEVRNA